MGHLRVRFQRIEFFQRCLRNPVQQQHQQQTNHHTQTNKNDARCRPRRALLHAKRHRPLSYRRHFVKNETIVLGPAVELLLLRSIFNVTFTNTFSVAQLKNHTKPTNAFNVKLKLASPSSRTRNEEWPATSSRHNSTAWRPQSQPRSLSLSLYLSLLFFSLAFPVCPQSLVQSNGIVHTSGVHNSPSTRCLASRCAQFA